MKIVIFFILIILYASILYSIPSFHKIELNDSFNLSNIRDIKILEKNIYIREPKQILVLDSDNKIITSLSHYELYDFIKKELNLPDHIEDTNAAIYAFDIDKYGNLWIATFNSIFVYNNGIIKTYNEKNSIFSTRIIGLSIYGDSIIFDPFGMMELYYLHNDSITKIEIPFDSMNLRHKGIDFGSILHNKNKFFYIGHNQNFIAKEDDNYYFFPYTSYTNTKNPNIHNILKSYQDTVYFFEKKSTLKLIKYCNKEFIITDSLEKKINFLFEEYLIDIKDFVFDKHNNLWMSVQAYDIQADTSEFYLLKYKNDSDIEVFNVCNITNGNSKYGFRVLYIDNKSEQFYAASSSDIYRYDMTTPVIDKIDMTFEFFLLSLYPNPTKDIFTIEFLAIPSQISKLKLKLYNYLGMEVSSLQPVISYNAVNGFGVMNVETIGIQDGLYFLVLESENYSECRNLIIQK